MTRRVLLLAPIASCLRAGAPEEISQLFSDAATALAAGKADGFSSYFDPGMPAGRQLRSNIAALIHAAETQSTITFASVTGDTSRRTVELNWTLQMMERDSAGGSTERKALVKCQVARQGGKWRIASLDPVEFFAPPHGREAWVFVVSAAAHLRADNVTEFLAAFEPAMPSYEQFRANVTALLLQADVESSLDMVSNEGDDTSRTVTVDWLLRLADPRNQARSTSRQQQVVCRLEKRGKNWRIVSIAPLALFAPPQA